MKTSTQTKTNMQRTQELGADFWNDSCALNELSEAVEQGAVGATSNPVIVYNAVNGLPEVWLPVLDRLIDRYPTDTEEEIAWRLIAELGKRAAALLEPVYMKTKGRKGFLCVQVNPQFYPNPTRMAEQAKHLARISPNIAIKIPATETGLAAMEETVAAGINVNATVSFSVSQAVAVAEAFERGMRKAEKDRIEMDQLHPYVTIMIGRVDDHMRRTKEKQSAAIEPDFLQWAGVAVFKKAYQVFQERKYRSTLLAAAYRNEMHWSELIGERLILSIPYKWWKQFNESRTVPARTIDKPVDANIVKELYGQLDEFRKACDLDAMKPADFARYGASVHTLQEFLEGYQKLLGLVRARMLKSS